MDKISETQDIKLENPITTKQELDDYINKNKIWPDRMGYCSNYIRQDESDLKNKSESDLKNKGELSMIPSCFIKTINTSNHTIELDLENYPMIESIELDLENYPNATWYNIEYQNLNYLEERLAPGIFNQELEFKITNQNELEDLFDFLNQDNAFVIVLRDKIGIRRLYGLTNPMIIKKIIKINKNNKQYTELALHEVQQSPSYKLVNTINSEGLISEKPIEY